MAQMMKNKKKIIFWTLISFLIFFIFLLIFFILLNFNIFNFLKEPVSFKIKDECSLVMDNIIYQIQDAGICRMMCINECEIRGMKYYKSDFSHVEDSCNNCECYCKQV